MNNILELIRNEEVKWVKLGDVCEIKSGQNISKMDIEKNKGIYPVINSGKEPLGFFNKWNTENDPIGITTRGAGVGSITYQEGKYFRGSLNYSVTVKDKDFLFHKFLYYLLNNMQSNIHKLCNFNGIPALNSSSLKELDIPIPSLELQEKIVKILDKYTDAYTKLQAALKKEIELRTKQYNYYRDMLLSQDYLLKKAKELCGQDAVVQWKEITEITNKIKNIKWNVEDSTKEYIYIDLSSVNLENNNITNPQYITKINAPSRAKQIIKTNDIIFGTTRPLLKRIAFIDEKFDNQICSTGYCVIRTNTVKINPRYVYYCMQTTDFYLNVGNYQKGASYPAISDADLKQIQIPIPPLEVQTHISAILDKYTSSYLQLQSTLSKEIEFRTKQYEYYREKLLNFKK